MQFKPSYLLGLNELDGLAYVQNLGLLMKRAPEAHIGKYIQFVTTGFLLQRI